MNSPEERRAEARRRRTERQREKRSQDRICGYCQEFADAGLITWFGRRSPLLIAICLRCLARLAGDNLDPDEVVRRCDLYKHRPCADCAVPSAQPDSPLGILRRLFSR